MLPHEQTAKGYGGGEGSGSCPQEGGVFGLGDGVAIIIYIGQAAQCWFAFQSVQAKYWLPNS